MTDTIYARIGDDLLPLAETPFPLEADLQALVADHPELLAGAQIDPNNPRRFVLVAREVAVPDRAAGGGRWALDHLFIDQDAIPTLVEVKRAANTQLRREVVGQLLDYAANAVRYWPVHDLEASFMSTHGDDADAALAELAGPDTAPDAFWQRVAANLTDGRVRLIFLADLIPTELQSIVEFLNERIDATEVLAIELRQYRTLEGLQILLPRVIGMTAAAKQAKGRSVPYDEIIAAATEATREAERHLLAWADERGHVTTQTAKGRRFATSDGVHLLYLHPNWATCEFTLQSIRRGDPALAEELHDRMQRLVSRTLTDKHPQLPTDDICNDPQGFVSNILDPYTAARIGHSRQRRPRST
jgi:hypothetical protein